MRDYALPVVAGVLLLSALMIGVTVADTSKPISRNGVVNVYDPTDVSTTYRTGISAVDSTGMGAISAVAQLASNNRQTVEVTVVSDDEDDSITLQCVRYSSADYEISRTQTVLSAAAISERAAGEHQRKAVVFDVAGAAYMKILVTSISESTDIDLIARTY